ncbi:thioredoxin family protein [Methanococcoides sp. FTZ1]|uniref:thioredoxin family protein n=1 Tax=Methanococcoides sp. FTZ1 TaxID=3439061 RepID=UPI003F854BC8
MFSLILMLAISNIVTVSATQSDEVMIEYFYEDVCLKCQQASPIIDSVISRHGNINYTSHNIATSYSIMKEYGVYTVPAIVINKSTVISYSDYEGDAVLLENLLVEAIKNAAPIPDNGTPL